MTMRLCKDNWDITGVPEEHRPRDCPKLKQKAKIIGKLAAACLLCVIPVLGWAAGFWILRTINPIEFRATFGLRQRVSVESNDEYDKNVVLHLNNVFSRKNGQPVNMDMKIKRLNENNKDIRKSAVYIGDLLDPASDTMDLAWKVKAVLSHGKTCFLPVLKDRRINLISIDPKSRMIQYFDHKGMKPKHQSNKLSSVNDAAHFLVKNLLEKHSFSVI